MQEKLQSHDHLIEGLKEMSSDNLKVIKQQMLSAYNEAEKVILEINRELERRGEK